MEHKCVTCCSNFMSSVVLLKIVLLLLMSSSVSSSSVVEEKGGLNKRSSGLELQQLTPSWSDGKQWINHMCAAQCDAFCNENPLECGQVCRSNATRTWIIKCHENQEKEAQATYYDTEDSYLTRNSECPGACSVLRDQEEAGYFIPPTPEVSLVRDKLTNSVTLTWTRPETTSSIVYVVQEKEESGPQHLRHWSEAHIMIGGDHFTRTGLGVCSNPTYRVAAVSRYGSHWFSDEITSSDLTPGAPEMLGVTNQIYDASLPESFVFTITWKNPEGWELPDLKPNKPFGWHFYIKCPPALYAVKPIEDKHSYSNNGNTLTFHIGVFAVGCKIIVAVNATSKCGDDLSSDRAYHTIDLACQSVKDIYHGEYCTPPPFDPPGNVQDVKIYIVPGMHGARAHVTWAPPTNLGSAGIVGYYTVFYGFVDEVWGFGFKDNIYFNVTVPQEKRQIDVPVLQPNNPNSKFGILVMAGAAGQTIDNPIGIMNVVNASFSRGKVLLDEDIVVYQIDESRVRVYWSPPPPSVRDVTGVALQWGKLSPRHTDVKFDSNDLDPAYNVTSDHVKFLVENTTVVNEAREKGPRD
ncbi:hypothetical protein V1264_019023 [Littorina saxatilis]|uniref:Fibronectin type-III domain-containing protein n=1 Tax=Littorina saxatilis TaxID=31220 RepID=A0AAN9BE08_9CAEN